MHGLPHVLNISESLVQTMNAVTISTGTSSSRLSCQADARVGGGRRVSVAGGDWTRGALPTVSRE